jgi:hypothetical protein
MHLRSHDKELKCFSSYMTGSCTGCPGWMLLKDQCSSLSEMSWLALVHKLQHITSKGMFKKKKKSLAEIWSSLRLIPFF